MSARGHEPRAPPPTNFYSPEAPRQLKHTHTHTHTHLHRHHANLIASRDGSRCRGQPCEATAPRRAHAGRATSSKGLPAAPRPLPLRPHRIRPSLLPMPCNARERMTRKSSRALATHCLALATSGVVIGVPRQLSSATSRECGDASVSVSLSVCLSLSLSLSFSLSLPLSCLSLCLSVSLAPLPSLLVASAVLGRHRAPRQRSLDERNHLWWLSGGAPAFHHVAVLTERESVCV